MSWGVIVINGIIYMTNFPVYALPINQTSPGKFINLYYKGNGQLEVVCVEHVLLFSSLA